MFTTSAANGALPLKISQIPWIAEALQKRLQGEGLPPAAPVAEPLFGRALVCETKVFSDRKGAGAMLAAKMSHLGDREDVTVLGIAHGGVVVAAEIARELRAPLTTWSVAKLRARTGVPITIGAVAEDGEMQVDEVIFDRLRLPPSLLVEEVRAGRARVKREAALYREATGEPELAGRTVVVVDDGIVSGFTMRATLLGLRRQRIRRVVLAVPVASLGLIKEFSEMVDEVVTLEATLDTPDLKQRYVHFPPVSCEEAVDLLQLATPPGVEFPA